MFIHWGIASLPGGVWNGRQIPGLAEWIQFKARIPLADYAALAREFNPAEFDARAWVRTAAEAGAKYVVFTAKHHDGFAMYNSAVSDYNICAATPFARDPLAELAAACQEFGIMLGLYYSQMIDWAHPHAVGPQCNDWDFDASQADFRRYWSGKAMPQLRELLSNYGHIGLLWFDMPQGMPPECAREAADLVRELQPGAVINSRLGTGGYADYMSMDDNYVNNGLPARDWETAATTNHTWGYSKAPGQWKPTAALCQALAYSVSRGGNYLLNIGPDASGALPAEAVEQFKGIGAWMKHAAPGIHGASAGPFEQSFEWGHISAKGSSLFLHVCDPDAREIVLPNVLTELVSAGDLATNAVLDHHVLVDVHGRHSLVVDLDPAGDDLPRTVELRFTTPPAVRPGNVQLPGQGIRLDIWRARVGSDNGHRWDFGLTRPGRYRVVVLSKETFSNADPQWWADGLTGTLTAASGDIPFTLRRDGEEDYPVIHFWKLVRSEIAEVTFNEPGPHSLALTGLKIVDSKWDESGVNVLALRLEPLQ